MLDSRGLPGQYREEEKSREEKTEAEIKRLMHETRIWRVANSAQWVAWGIVQAKVPGMDEALNADKSGGTPDSHTTIGPEDQKSRNTSSSDPLGPDTAPLRQDIENKRPEGIVADSPPKRRGISQ